MLHSFQTLGPQTSALPFGANAMSDGCCQPVPKPISRSQGWTSLAQRGRQLEAAEAAYQALYV